MMVLGGVIALFGGIKTGVIISIFAGVAMAVTVGISAATELIAWIVVATILAVGVFAFIMFRTWYRDKKEIKQTRVGIEKAKRDPDVWGKLKHILEESQDEDIKKKIKQEK